MELTELYFNNIIKKTGLSRGELENLVSKKRRDLKEFSKLNVLYAICKEFSINVKTIYESLEI
jgi:hypothetical protein